ncbi:DUF4199 domain-containing protein [Balneola sp. MJW-20]|uniref:DUF4199 domain-containing protein n=1 Tax=Gracilimonas aurantiaca TaxID=3234185 RepID=UPI003465ED88
MDNEQGYPSYWSSVLMASVITALIFFIVSLIGGYSTINAEPSGSLIQPAQFISMLACLFAAVGGVFANWHYARGNDLTYKIGKGALLGLLTGVIAAIISVILGLIWEVIDPAYAQNVMDATIANFEAMPNMTQEMIEQTRQQMEFAETPLGLLVSAGTAAIMLGIVNVVSGLIGAKIFASEE